MRTKKALAKEELVILIILIISFLFLTLFLVFLFNQSDDASKELACRLSVLQRAALKEKISGVSFGGFFCETIEKDIGKRETTEKDAVLYQMAEYTAKCWNMFGEGALSTLKDGADFWRSVSTKALRFTTLFENNAYCFVCYEVDIYDITNKEGKQTTITEGDFVDFLSSKVYIAESNPVEMNCDDGEDNDGDGAIDCADTDNCEDTRNNGHCIVKDEFIKNPCEAQGGECKNSCEPYSEVEHVEPEWSCKEEDKKCCLNRNNVYTYNDYIRYHGGSGGQIALLSYEDSILFEPGENYAIGYVEPIDDGKKDSYVIVGKYQDIAQYCQVK